MLKIIKNFNWIVLSSFLSIFLGIITFLTFINQGFVTQSSKNLQILLVIDILLLVLFFSLIFNNVWKIYQAEKKNKLGSKTNLRYISLFSLFTFIPSLLIALFSLFLFSFGVEKFFNDRITKAVNNSYNVSKSYLAESKKTVKTDIILMNVGIDRASNYFYSDLNRFINIVRSEKILRRVNDVYLIDSVGSIIISELDDPNSSFISPTEDNFNDAVDGYPVLVTNNLENKTSFLMKLNNLIDTYLYISRNIDPEILDYLNETEQAVDFYYTVKNSQTGIKISFAVIYIIVVTLLLFLSTVVAISFATGLTRPIINLITASEKISKGELNTKVDSSSEDIEFKILNNNFNNMIERLKKQQDKLLLSERYSAWESVARKLAHEIKNPLTPIQLSIDRLREKYASKISDGHDEFKSYLQTINRQIKDIERLVNEFSNFARMPAPVFKKVNIYGIIKRAKDFLKISIKSTLNFKN